MADAWKRLNEKVKEKRTKKDPPKDHRRRPKGEELTVQRLSAEVSGKAQKYTRINWASGIRAFRRRRRDSVIYVRFPGPWYLWDQHMSSQCY